MPTAAAARLVDALLTHGVDRAFCVPGESYLNVLDALRDSGIHTVSARQEGGAAMMAEADAKLTGRPGVCFVTRGPGATNASAGVHVAEQDSTPLVLFVGQVATGMLGRGAFQEVDYQQFFGGIAKRVFQLSQEDDPAVIVTEAFRIASSGRPGPVVVALPEDVQGALAGSPPPVRPAVPEGIVPGNAALDELAERLASTERPMVIAGGSGWTAAAAADLQQFAESWQLPVSVVFRRQQLFDHDHPNYAGDCGIGLNPALRARIEAADLVLLLGTRFSEIPSQGYTLLEAPRSGQQLVHVHVAETGRFPHAEQTIACHPRHLLQALAGRPATATDRTAWVTAARAEFEAWSGQPPVVPGRLQMGQIIQMLRATLPDNAILTNGAGNYATWIHRFFRFRGYATQLAPTSGSMGYGLPAAVAAGLRFPDRPVVCLAGDGCFQMTGQEFGTAVQYGAKVIVLVVDNGMFGTIRMHQERRFPRRPHATDIVNPDFAALARAYGGFGATVDTTEAFPAALDAALAAEVPAILHLKLDPQAITPNATLAELAGH
ncbi:MAG TPA: thiamine pyrophosphate-binding protein [Pseudomonadales bacterium]